MRGNFLIRLLPSADNCGLLPNPKEVYHLNLIEGTSSIWSFHTPEAIVCCEGPEFCHLIHFHPLPWVPCFRVIAACCSESQYVVVNKHTTHEMNKQGGYATHCNKLQHNATHCNTLHLTATLQHNATRCTLQHCNTIQHDATKCPGW